MNTHIEVPKGMLKEYLGKEVSITGKYGDLLYSGIVEFVNPGYFIDFKGGAKPWRVDTAGRKSSGMRFWVTIPDEEAKE